MKHHLPFTFLVVVVFMLALLPAASPVRAAGAAVGQFYAGCGNFSVDVSVGGSTNDGDGHDRVWYQVSDGTGKVLFQEFAWRSIYESAGSVVVDMAYTLGTPTQNPISFQVIDLDSNNKMGAVLAGASYDAPCLGASHKANRFGTFFPPKRMFGTITATSPFYLAPGSNQLNFYARPGASLQVIYRTPDASWVAIFLSGNDLLWIPAGVISVDLSQVAVPPTQLDRSSLDPASTGSSAAPAVAASAPTGVTGIVLVDGLRLRSAPNYTASMVTSLPFGSQVAILGRNAPRTFVKANYNGQVGWLSAGYVRLNAGTVGALPVVQ